MDGCALCTILMHNWSNKPARHTYHWLRVTHMHTRKPNDRSHVCNKGRASEEEREIVEKFRRTVRSNHFHEINWFYFAVCRPISVCVCGCMRAQARQLYHRFYSMVLCDAAAAGAGAQPNVAKHRNEWNFFIKKKFHIKMRDKERKVEEHFFIPSFFFGSAAAIPLECGPRPKIEWHIISSCCHRHECEHEKRRRINKTSSIDKMYWQSPNICLSLKCSIELNSIKRLAAVTAAAVCHIQIRSFSAHFSICEHMWMF